MPGYLHLKVTNVRACVVQAVGRGMHRSCRFGLGLAVPWLIFKRVLQMNTVSVSLIKFMIMHQHVQLIKI